MLDILAIILVIFALALIAQSVFNIYATLYAWDDPERLARAKAPDVYAEAKNSFTVLLPCRDEAEVIGETIRKLSLANYPTKKFELLILCTPDDTETIRAAQTSIKENGIKNARVIVFDQPSGKSRAMNIGLKKAKGNLVTIFDSEDDVSPEIFNIANTYFVKRDIDVLQGGVQLMDYKSHWFSAHNVLEYFFWFKSRMHFHAKMGIVPLGGNTVFFRKRDLKAVGGWDENCLTEDGDIGIRLSLIGRKFDVMYDADHVTREETPPNVKAFIKQRARWNQGFLQILAKKDWRQLGSLKQAALILYVLFSPVFMSFVIVLSPLLILSGFLFKVPVIVSLLTFMPLFLSILNILISMIGLHEFGKDQKLKIGPHMYIWLAITFLPYQFLLASGALRGVWREFKGQRGWDKTAHTGAHRQVEEENSAPALEPATATDKEQS